MKTGIIIGLLTACIGVSLYLAKADKPFAKPEPAVNVTTDASAPSAPPAPIVSPEVIEMIDLDALLDLPSKPVAGEPFDAPPAPLPVSTPSVPERIPPAVD